MIKKGEKLILLLLTAAFAVILIFFLFIRFNSDYPISLSLLRISSASCWSEDGKLNINTATAEMLTQIPGIGETLSNRIVQYRDEHGPFNNLNDLTNVKGIGKGTLTKIQDYLMTGE